MEASAVDDKVVKEVICRDAVVECHGIAEVFVPKFVDDGTDEECSRFFGGDVRVVVVEFGGVSGFHAAADHRRCVIFDGDVVRGDAARSREGCTPRCGVG